MKNILKKINIRKGKKIKLGYVLVSIVLLFVILLGIKMILPNNSSKYGDRLEGINSIPFGKTEKNKIIDKIKKDEKVESCKLNVEGKLITIIFDVKKDTSIDDAKKIASDSLEVVGKKVKDFYDIQFMISKKNEETKEDAKKEFPIMGYKNKKTSGIVW
ncbi:MAG: hypothetical protein IIZ40_04345 [Bacilli bacterium]|nr:hypothetical protein [Bacilli bacterium]